MKDKNNGMMRQVAKEQWIKTSFWMPENADEELKAPTTAEGAATATEEKPKMMCPYSRNSDTTLSHKLRFKDLITLKLTKDEQTKEFLCEVCRKQLGLQKIVALRKCGHAMC